MTSAIRLVLGVSVLAMAVGSAGCSSSSDGASGGGPTIVGGSGNSTGGTGNSSGGSGGGTSAAGVPLTPMMGWVDGMSNDLKIQGAFFTYADDTTKMSVTDDTMSSAKICIKGTAAKVMMLCTIVAPAVDCYGTYWGAAIGFNLNQPNVPDPSDPTGMKMMGGMPMPYDASAIKGFSFDVDGATIPLPTQFRFNIEDATTQYCTPGAKGVKPGTNTYMFTDVVSKCYATPPGPDASTIQKGVVKISWQVVTNTSSTVPFDFCISNVRALQ